MKKLIGVVFGILIVALATFVITDKQSSSTPVLPKPPLRELAAKHDIQMGNFAIASLIHEKPYADILTN